MKIAKLKIENFRIFLLLILSLISFFPLVTHAQTADALTLFGYNLNCSPELAPNAGGCSFTHALGFIVYALDKVSRYVLIPLAVLVMMWAGFVIMTAGGSEEKVKKGKALMLSAVIGIAIALAAPLFVDIVYKIFTSGGRPVTP